jgi:hypothetical protein
VVPRALTREVHGDPGSAIIEFRTTVVNAVLADDRMTMNAPY